jgi:hypothetical protein
MILKDDEGINFDTDQHASLLTQPKLSVWVRFELLYSLITISFAP